MNTKVRFGAPSDAAQIVSLIRELAANSGEHSPLAEEFVPRYLAAPGCHALLAEADGRVLGLLSYVIRPNLWHGGNTALIEELVVTADARGQGIGSALLAALFEQAQQAQCIEVSVSTMPDNHRAIRLYRAHGMVDEALLLERHLHNR